ncbi:MAG: hypothetical protein WD069_00350 [Planctomycetales bacterium]
MDQIKALVAELGFVVVDQDTALGQMRGIPTALTVFAADPPGLMCQWRVNPTGIETQTVMDLLEGVPQERAALSIEDGCAWLTLYDARSLDGATIRLLFEQVADALQSSDLAPGPGCVRCGRVEDAQLMYVAGRATRLCPGCLTDAAQERQCLEAQLNRPSLASTLGLPGAAIYVAAGWAGFWTVLDLALEHWRIEVVEINRFTMFLFWGALVAIGIALGWPAGVTVRRSLAFGRMPRVASVLFILAAATAGEILYVALLLLRMVGVFNLRLAAQLLPQVLDSYTKFWISCKVALLVATAFFCAASASQRKTVRLDV